MVTSVTTQLGCFFEDARKAGGVEPELYNLLKNANGRSCILSKFFPPKEYERQCQRNVKSAVLNIFQHQLERRQGCLTIEMGFDYMTYKSFS